MTESTERLSLALAERYRILSRLGEGGMATVYLAEDLKHDRKVAVKVLRPELAAVLGADRFVREIKTTANLQHPHILPLFDSGEADSFLYYVMPYIDGEALRAKLDRETQLGIDEAVTIAANVADALDYAHRQGVIHRDVKPENILLHDGRPVVADFGIALAVSAAAGGRMTETGLSLGTPHYMSPEQATAEKEISARSDVYSLGSVLYEMLAGEPPHLGNSAQQIIMKIIADDARPVTELRKSVPPNVAAAVTKSLAKLPADRFATAAEFAVALTDSSFSHTDESTTKSVKSDIWNPVSIALAAVVTLLMLALVLALVTGEQTEFEEVSTTRFTIPVRGGLDLGFWGMTPFAYSPDGRTLVYATGGLLYKRSLSEFEDSPIPGTEGAAAPFFSADGEWIGFTQYPNIKKVPLEGGTPVLVVDHEAQLGASWGSDGSIVYAEDLGTAGLWRVPSSGGEPSSLTTVNESAGETLHVWPQILPETDAVLFTVVGPSGTWEDGLVVIQDFGRDKRDTVASGATFGRYIPTGHVLYVSDEGTVLALPYDIGTRRSTGAPFALLDSVPVNPSAGRAMFEVSGTGNVAFLRGSSDAWNVLRWVERDGDWLADIGPPLHGNFLRLSPDGRRLAMGVRLPANASIWLIDGETGKGEPFTFAPAEEETPVWSPDGARLAFKTTASGQASLLHVKPVDRAEEAQLLVTRPGHLHLTDWSPDARWILGFEVHPDSSTDILAFDTSDSGAALPVATSRHSESGAVLSPDGQWLAYESDESGLVEVYLMSFPGLARKRRVTTNGGELPRWARSGNELFFMRNDSIFAVPVSRESNAVTVGSSEPLFSVPHLFEYDVAPDGRRFVVRLVNEAGRQKEIYIVQGLFAELGRAID